MEEMKTLLFSVLIVGMTLTGCDSSVEKTAISEGKELTSKVARQDSDSTELIIEEVTQATTTPKPESLVFGGILVGDFNGDQRNDTVQEISQGELSGYLVTLSGSRIPDTLGIGREYGSLFKDFSWVDSWKVVAPGKFDEVTFSEDGDVLGSRKVETSYDAIELLADEIGGGILAWKQDGGWFWIHQTD